MRGYYSNKGAASLAPSPIGGIDNSTIIGIPPLMYANLNTNLSANTRSFIPVNNIAFSTLKSLNTYWNFQFADISNYITKSLGGGFTGYTNKYNILANDIDYKLQFTNPNTDIITSQNVYDVGVVLFKFIPKSLAPDSIKTPYASLFSAAEAYNSGIKPNLSTYIPVWTGDFGINWEEAQSNFNVFMKQNKHYASLSAKGSTGESYLLDGRYLNRYHNSQDADNLTNNLFYTEFNSGQLDTNWSIPNPHNCVLRSLWGGNKFDITSLTDIIQNSSSKSGLPYFLDNRGARIAFYSGMSFETGVGNIFRKSYISEQSTFNSLYDNYGYKQENTQNYVVLPKISSNQMVYGGDGSGVMDKPLIDSYVYNNHTFASNSPARYMYLNTTYSLVGGKPTYTTNAVYLVLTYLKNNVILLNNTSNYNYLGHFRINNANGITT